jgi:hypothetical protein
MTQAQNVAKGSSNIDSSGVLLPAGGGTGVSTSPTAGGINYGTGTAQAYTAAGTSGYYLQSNGASAPSWSAVTIPTVIPAGSVFLLYQSAAPTGWTQVTTLNDYDLRLVSGAGGTTGGTTAYSTVFANQTPSFTGAIGTLASGATTLALSQIASHIHASGAYRNNNCQPNGTYMGGGDAALPYYTDAQGGGGSHSHSLSGTPGGTVGAVTLNVRYANMILCSKN